MGDIDLPLTDIPDRDNYSGEIFGGTVLVDAATATPWHDKIRLIADRSAVILSRAEARELAGRLMAAVSRIDEERKASDTET